MTYSKQAADENKLIDERAKEILDNLGFDKSNIEINDIGRYTGQTREMINQLTDTLRQEFDISRQRLNSRIAKALRRMNK